MWRHLLSVCLLILAGNAHAGERCFVRAPSETATVHSGPHGALLQAALNNGEQVQMWRVEKDRSGRRWAYVTPTSGGAPGYVFREHLVCF